MGSSKLMDSYRFDCRFVCNVDHFGMLRELKTKVTDQLCAFGGLHIVPIVYDGSYFRFDDL